MALDFPSSPSNGQEYTNPISGVVYTYNSAYSLWEIKTSNTAAGSNTYVQYNSSGSLGANANFTYDYSTTTLTLATNATVNTVITAGLITISGANVMTTDTTLKVYYSNGSVAFP